MSQNILTDYISAAYAVINNRSDRLTEAEREHISRVLDRGGYMSLCLHSGNEPEIRLTLLDSDGSQSLIYALRKEVTAH